MERIKEVKNLKSILFIYSYADKWTPVEMGERFTKNSNIPAELWTVETAEHAQIMKSEHKTEYEIKFFHTLKRQSGKFNKVLDEGKKSYNLHLHKPQLIILIANLYFYIIHPRYPIQATKYKYCVGCLLMLNKLCIR